MKEDTYQLTGKQKAAIFLISLGKERAAGILKKLDIEEVEQLTQEIANWDNISPELIKEVWKEFSQMKLAQHYANQGGEKYAREILEKALGDHKALDIISNLKQRTDLLPLDILESIDPQQLLSFLQSEHPQTIALILSHLKSKQAAIILSSLPEKLQLEVTTRIINIEEASPEALKEVNKILRKEFSYTSEKGKLQKVGGTKMVAEILNRVDRATEKRIMEAMEKRDAQLAKNVKNLMFVFEDILSLDDRSLQRALREIDTKELTLALKGADKKLKEKFFKNLSSRAVETIKEDMEFMGPVRLRNVEEAQQKIVNIMRRLEEKGEIVGRQREEGEQLIV